uniref:Palmitoyltransferase n=3 Tax=Parascaris univalens TaxID=6257 RepID=A0A915AAG4_PARUN
MMSDYRTTPVSGHLPRLKIGKRSMDCVGYSQHYIKRQSLNKYGAVLFSAYVCCFYIAYLIRVVPLIEDNCMRWISSTFVTFSYFMYLWCLITAVFTQLPLPPKKFYLSEEEVTEIIEEPGNSEAILKRHIQLFNIHVEELNEDGTIRYCEACMCIRPDRAHHCSECNTCVLRRDHHCAVMNSCIHQDNTKAYLLHLFYGSLYTSLAFISDFKFTYFDIPEDRGHFWFAGSFAYFTCMQLSTWLWIIYVCLIPRNLMLRDKWNRSCPYGNLGWRGNLRRIFGSNPFLWLIPTRGIYEYKED